MKRTELTRHTPLGAGAPLARARAPRTKRRRDTGPSQKVRDLVAHRSSWACERCGNALATNVHHRRPRGMGGTKRAESNAPSGLLHLCGSGTTGCHGWVESHRDMAIVQGLLCQQHQDPAATPVFYRGRWALLDDEGGVTET